MDSVFNENNLFMSRGKRLNEEQFAMALQLNLKHAIQGL
jgi:hypothetical protein